MGKKILVLSDFSKSSWNALQYGITLYKGEPCNFYILNVFFKDGHANGSHAFLDPEDTYNRMTEQMSKDGLGDILNQLSKNRSGNDHYFYVLSKSGPFMEIVEQSIDELEIDLILMGAKGMDHLYEDNYGKKAVQVIKNTKNCPTLIVPPKASNALPEKIVFATELDVEISAFEMMHLVELAELGSAQIQVLGIVQGKELTSQQEKCKNAIQSFLQGIDFTFHLIINIRKSIALNCCVEMQHSDLISFIQPKPTIWETLGLGRNELDKWGYYDDVPVLTLNQS
jgi:nucleotide-binding universal stress UspA family protein